MPKEHKLSDYKPLDFVARHIDLTIDLTQQPFQVKATLTIVPKSLCNQLILDGQNIKLTYLAMNGKKLDQAQYEITEESLIINNLDIDQDTPPFTIEMITELGINTDLFGLYETEGIALVKAETEGMRRLFYCIDRPDNLATYKTTIIADAERYPVLLSNGELTESKKHSNGTHQVTWVDDLKKPTYLFAMVAGKLSHLSTTYTNQKEATVSIDFYVPESAMTQCQFAQEVVKAAMAWDEIRCNLPCELKSHKVAGVDKYASGASEPTGLNLFNTANLYAHPSTRTDVDILRVMEVVAHEWFHYHTGNRVTILNWFNLPFKEGLTTFRAELFREDLFGADVVRLLDGKNLDERAPRQNSYTSVRSLYTAAAYEKSASIFRMIMLYVGKDNFLEALTAFLTENDKSAVTLEDLITSLSKTTNKDLQPFLAWFTEPGIPHLSVTDNYNKETKTYTLKINTQDKVSRPITLMMGLLNDQGQEVVNDRLLIINQPEMEFTFKDQTSPPVPSLLRSFSAPVTLDYQYSVKQLLTLIKSDSNAYNRCEAAKQLFSHYVIQLMNNEPLELEREFLQTFNWLLKDKTLSPWLLAELLTIPSVEELVAKLKNQDISAICSAHYKLSKLMGDYLSLDLMIYQAELPKRPTSPDTSSTLFDLYEAGKRRIEHVTNCYLFYSEPDYCFTQLITQFEHALKSNRTQTLNALKLICEYGQAKSEQVLNQFYDTWKEDNNAISDWLRVQAGAHDHLVIQKVTELLSHPAFDKHTPNKVYALIGTFSKNAYGFHDISGKGYILVADFILDQDKISPAVAARLVESFANWHELPDDRKEMMQKQLAYINDNAVSADVRTAVKKLLANAKVDPPVTHLLAVLGLNKTTPVMPNEESLHITLST